MQHLGKGDPILLSMLTQGWGWTILPWQVEDTWPALPDLAQRALNASNSVASQASELEMAASIAEFAQLDPDKVDWASCVEAAAATMPACKGYLDTIGRYVKLYGGGHGAPMIHYLDEFAKQFGANQVLGEEFLTAVTNVTFSSASNLYPHIRTGLIATNLISSKVVDGISRLLVKSDVERLKHNQRAKIVAKAEEIMEAGWNVAMELVANGSSTADVYPVLGRLHTRTVLHITGKAKLGVEKREFPDIDSIKKCCVAELVALLPKGAALPGPWKGAAAASPAGASPAAQEKPVGEAMVEISQLSDPAWLAKQAGFVVGKAYAEKGLDAREIFVLTEIGAEGARLRKHDALDPEAATDVIVDLDSFLKKWGDFKGELPATIPCEHVMTRSVATSPHFEMEVLKATVFRALQKHEATQIQWLSQLVFMANPSDVRAMKQIPKGKLELAPATELRCISAKHSQNAPKAEVASMTFFMSEPIRPRSTKSADWKAEAVFVPYWWVGSTSNQDEANLALKRHCDKDSGVSFNTLTNQRIVKPGERLLVFKKKVMKTSSAKAAPPSPSSAKAASPSSQAEQHCTSASDKASQRGAKRQKS